MLNVSEGVHAVDKRSAACLAVLFVGMAYRGTDALLPNGRPNLYSVAGNQIHGERLAKQNRQDSEWWAKYRTVTDLKFQYAVGAVPDKKEVVMPEQPRMKLGKEASADLDDAALSKMSSMQADFYFGQTSELWDYYREKGTLQKKTYNKKGLPGRAHSSRTARWPVCGVLHSVPHGPVQPGAGRRSVRGVVVSDSSRARCLSPHATRRLIADSVACRLRCDATRLQLGRHRLLLASALTTDLLRMEYRTNTTILGARGRKHA